MPATQTTAFLSAMREKAEKQARGAFRAMLKEQAAGRPEQAKEAEGYGYGVVWTFNDMADLLCGPYNHKASLSSSTLIKLAGKDLEAAS